VSRYHGRSARHDGHGNQKHDELLHDDLLTRLAIRAITAVRIQLRMNGHRGHYAMSCQEDTQGAKDEKLFHDPHLYSVTATCH
jgi:hypothetical protein